jgi:hypothetical protein
VKPHFRPLEDDWFLWQSGEGPTVKVQVATTDAGRVRICALQVEGEVSADVLRKIPVGRIEAAANAELHPDADGAPHLGAVVPDELRSPTGGYPDAFYDFVATAYRHLAGTSSRPVGELADANDVPVTTAQRWVKEARRRGLLAPGHPGKAG